MGNGNTLRHACGTGCKKGIHQIRIHCFSPNLCQPFPILRHIHGLLIKKDLRTVFSFVGKGFPDCLFMVPVGNNRRRFQHTENLADSVPGHFGINHCIEITAVNRSQHCRQTGRCFFHINSHRTVCQPVLQQ